MADPLLVKAVKNNSPNGVTKLLNGGGINVNQANASGRTALWLASRDQQIRIMEKLLTAGVDVNKADNDGKTPLFIATERGHEAAVKMLLDAGADVNKADKDGKTPLSVASTEPIKKLIISKMLNIPFNEVGININIIISGSQTVDDLKLILRMAGEGNISNQITETNIIGARKQAKTLHNKYLENLKAKVNADQKAWEKARENAALKEAMERANALRRNEEEKKANRVAKVARNFKTVLQTKVAERKEANAKTAANKAAANKAAAIAQTNVKKNFAEKINSIKGGNFNKLKNINLTNLTDAELKGILQTLSVKGTTEEHKETMKKLLKIWIERGKTLNSAEISKNSPFIKSLNADIKRITNNYALRQKFKSTSSNLGITSNTPNTIKKALLTQNGREGIIKSYGLGIPAISPIPEIVSALHKRGSFKNSITLNSLKKEYQNLREAYAGGNQNTQKQLNAAITSISLITNANMRAKINQLKQNIPNELLSGNAKIGLILKSNGSPYKLVNYTKINQAIKNFKATGKNQNLNNSDIITNAANGTWSLVEVSKNLLKQ
jgi:ankyrin repeat protein